MSLCCCVEPLGEGHGHGASRFVQWALGPPVGFTGAEGGLAEPARPGLGPGGGTWSPGSCSSPLSWHLPPPALAVGVGFGCGLGLLKAGLHFITAPGRAR